MTICKDKRAEVSLRELKLCSKLPEDDSNEVTTGVSNPGDLPVRMYHNVNHSESHSDTGVSMDEKLKNPINLNTYREIVQKISKANYLDSQ